MKSTIPFLGPFLTLVLFCSCSATMQTKKDPEKAPPAVESEFRTAEAAARTGDKKAVARLKKIVQQNPESDVADDSHLLMGQLNEKNQQFNEALANYEAIIRSPVASPLEAEAALRATRIHLKLSQINQAEELLQRAPRWNRTTPEQAIELQRLRFETYSATKKYLAALEAAVDLGDNHPVQAEKDKYRAAAREIVETRLSEEDLRQVADQRKYSFLQAPAKFRYAGVLIEQRQYSQARRMLEDVVELAPKTDLAERSTSLIQQLEARNRVEPRTIGVVLPLSGKQAGIGQKALRGIQLGLGTFSKSGFKLAVIDSEGNPDTARRAVERLVQEDHIIAIVGGLLSKTATAEAAKAQELGIPAIMLSQKSGITEAGEFIFRNSLTSQMQVQYLVEFAMNRLGYKRFGVMFPNDAYGVEFTNLFWDEVKARGGEIRGAQPYNPSETDFRGHVQRLVGIFYLEDRADEYRLRLKAWNEKNQKRSARQGAPPIEDLLPPIVDFDAIFIPDSVRAVGQIAPMLAYNNVSGVPLLGTNLWNSQGLITRGQKFVEGATFVDSFMANDPNFLNSEFYTNYKATFSEEPALTEVQAYDSALILRNLIASGETTRASLRDRMASLQNFPGAVGRLSVNADREFRRPLAALTVTNGQIVDVESNQRK